MSKNGENYGSLILSKIDRNSTSEHKYANDMVILLISAKGLKPFIQ